MDSLKSKIKAIAFDADDTLWENETLFRKAEKEFSVLLKDYMDEEKSQTLLFDMEMANLPLYGYGIKPFTLSLIEAALKISDYSIPLSIIQKLLDMGKEMLNEPVQVLNGVEETLQNLNGHYRLVVATKGDLLDQERKLVKSGLEEHFHHIEVMSDKTFRHYKKLIGHLDVSPEEFLMVGNSVKSDVLPVLEAGGYAVHVPFHTTWAHEVVKEETRHERFGMVSSITEILDFL